MENQKNEILELINVKKGSMMTDRIIKANFRAKNGDYSIILGHGRHGYTVVVNKGVMTESPYSTGFMYEPFTSNETLREIIATASRYSAKKLQELWDSEETQISISRMIVSLSAIDTATKYEKDANRKPLEQATAF